MAAKCVWSLDWIFVSLKWLLIFLPINTVRGRQRDLIRLLYTVEAEKKAILCRTVGRFENLLDSLNYTLCLRTHKPAKSRKSTRLKLTSELQAKITTIFWGPRAPSSYGPTMGCTLGVQNCRDFGLELGSQFQSGALS